MVVAPNSPTLRNQFRRVAPVPSPAARDLVARTNPAGPGISGPFFRGTNRELASMCPHRRDEPNFTSGRVRKQ